MSKASEIAVKVVGSVEEVATTGTVVKGVAEGVGKAVKAAGDVAKGVAEAVGEVASSAASAA